MSILKSKCPRWLRWFTVVGLLLLSFGYFGTQTKAPKMPTGVTKEVLHLTLADRKVSVTMYYPAKASEAPLVVVAHGFTRSKRNMAGWGVALAREGFMAAVLTQPALANHELNARVMAEMLDQMRHGRVALKVKPGPRAALMGFSMGGLTTFLAAAKQPVDAWVGLDPVGMDNSWLKVAKQSAPPPCAILRAEPGAWNLKGNARALASALPTPAFHFKVRGATHLDAESNTDFLGRLACGGFDAKRHEVFERYALAFLKATIKDDAEARRMIKQAADDTALTEVTLPKWP